MTSRAATALSETLAHVKHDDSLSGCCAATCWRCVMLQTVHGFAEDAGLLPQRHVLLTTLTTPFACSPPTTTLTTPFACSPRVCVLLCVCVCAA